MARRPDQAATPASRWRPSALSWRVALWSVLALATLPLASVTLDYARDPRNLPLRTIRVTGALRHLERSELEAVVAATIDGNFFTVDMAAVRARVRQLPWVDQVSIRRVWPQTLVMEVVEQVPLAQWGGAALVNARGEVFAPETGVPERGLVRLYGPPGSAPRVVDFYRLATARLQDTGLVVQRLGLDERRDWVLELHDGLRLALGQDGEVERLERFLRAYPLLANDSERQPHHVDLRYAQGFAVSWRPRPAVDAATAASKAREGDA
ncbi:MAG: cell division protein FtsQ [Pseudomonadota bacterium]|jgi:cell division protein FtsQ